MTFDPSFAFLLSRTPFGFTVPLALVPAFTTELATCLAADLGVGMYFLSVPTELSRRGSSCKARR